MKHAAASFIALAGLLCSSASAGVILSIQPSTVFAAPGDSGDSFDVVLMNTGPSSISVAAFAFEVSVADPDITLTGSDFSTGAFSYIFAGDSFDVINGFTLNTSTPGQTLDGSDLANDGAGVVLTSGESLGLGRVLFSVSPAAAIGPFLVSFTGSTSVPDSNSLADPSANAINIDTFSNGGITIDNANSVPEPSSFLLALAGMAALGRLRLRVFRQ